MFVSSYGTLGGSEIYLERLIAHLDPDWVKGVVLLGDGPLADHLRPASPVLQVIPTTGGVQGMVASSRRLRRALREIDPSVVHANGVKAAIVTLLATLWTRMPVVWVRHDFSFDGWRARALARRCTRVVCVSEAIARTFVGHVARKVVIVHTGLPDVVVPRDEARRHLESDVTGPDPGFVISLVGRLVPGKGHQDLVAIAPAILERIPKARFLLIGGEASSRYADYVIDLTGRIEEEDLMDTVAMLGYRDDVLPLIAASDVVVMPSMSSYRTIETEGFPLLALEAMALGTPVVAYGVGGIPEAVGDCGLLVAPGDRGALTDAIVKVGSDRPLRERIAICGRQRVVDRFSISGMVTRLQEVYTSASAGRT